MADPGPGKLNITPKADLSRTILTADGAMSMTNTSKWKGKNSVSFCKTKPENIQAPVLKIEDMKNERLQFIFNR